ncbi:MAG: chorismate mutase [Candidatus Bathyarchaeia archaeon]
MDELELYRKQVDQIDDLILKALTERVKICMAIGLVKKKRGIPIKDLSRENDVYRKVKDNSAEFGLDSQKLEAIYREIVNMCSAVQE